jgi:hypothetical protein
MKPTAVKIPGSMAAGVFSSDKQGRPCCSLPCLQAPALRIPLGCGPAFCESCCRQTPHCSQTYEAAANSLANFVKTPRPGKSPARSMNSHRQLAQLAQRSAAVSRTQPVLAHNYQAHCVLECYSVLI